LILPDHELGSLEQIQTYANGNTRNLNLVARARS
jgi:hypothetical protein